MMEVGSWSDVASATATCLALVAAIYTFSRQKTASDVETVLSIFDRINEYWDRIAEKGVNPHDFGQILAYYENVCFLANRKIISSKAFDCIKDHIFEIWSKIEGRHDLSELKNALISSDNTFMEIKKFIERHRGQIERKALTSKIINKMMLKQI